VLCTALVSLLSTTSLGRRRDGPASAAILLLLQEQLSGLNVYVIRDQVLQLQHPTRLQLSSCIVHFTHTKKITFA
jgi:hypothetical protein